MRQALVYKLLDQDGQLLYVGSTDQLRERLNAHRGVISFATCETTQCETRTAAYKLEQRLFDELRPPLNRRRPVVPNPDSSKAWLRIQVPEEVHRKLKATAALEGLTLSEYVEQVLTEATKEDEK